MRHCYLPYDLPGSVRRFLDRIRPGVSIIVETALDYAMPGPTKGIEIVASKLGDLAGITGGAVLARQRAK